MSTEQPREEVWQSSQPSPMQSAARLDRDIDRCKSRTQQQNINEAERLGRETAKQPKRTVPQGENGLIGISRGCDVSLESR
ncbi:unnamed protein product [Rangifer tarandus platyrhynchus]|uniref:Uncharacterized protein n=1 Tax=Rangifer tarandus platyrhynchus TaxID=3082113 RepID=A0AC59Y6G2_RANTA